MVLVLMGRGDTTRMTFWLVITYDDMARDDALSKSLRDGGGVGEHKCLEE